MPRTRGGTGPGALTMGGPGKKPATPPTPFGGGVGGARGALVGAVPIRPRGGPRAAPGAIGPSPGGGVGAFKRGGSAEKKEHVEKHARGGAVEKHDDEKEDRQLFGKMMHEHDKKEEVKKHAKGGAVQQFARGGPVMDRYVTRKAAHEHPAEEGIHRGADSQRGAALKGADVASTSTKMSDSKPRVGRGHNYT